MVANDKKILNYIQQGIPFIRKPFLKIAKDLKLSEDYLLKRIKILKKKKYIREISAIFEARALGYKSTLVALAVPKYQIRKVVSSINKHPGVSHNYERECEFNVWFTLTIEKKKSFENEIRRMLGRVHSIKTMVLVSKRLYKINATFGLGKEGKKKNIKRKVGKIKLNKEIKKVIVGLQGDLPLVEEPFKKIAKTAGLSEDKLLKIANKLKTKGVIRKYIGTVKHNKIGFKANAMVVWRVPELKTDNIGKKFAKYSCVSHCYKRTAHKDWTYNLYTMVHAKNDSELARQIRDMAKTSNIKNCIPLYTKKEFKKQRVKYFIKQA